MAELLHQQKAQVDARARPFAGVLHRALTIQAAQLLAEFARGGEISKILKAKETSMGELIARYGLRTARDAHGRATQIVLRDSSARVPRISEWEGYLIDVQDRGDEVTFESREAFKREIQRVIEDAQAFDITPTQTDIARELRARLTGKTTFDDFVPGGDFVGFDGAFTFERASRIARTELAIAENTGLVEGYKDSGVEELEWLAFKSPIWPRRHDKMHGKRAKVDGTFTLPSGVKVRFPCDPSAPVGEIVHCRCSMNPVLEKKKPGKKPKPEPEPTPTPEPVRVTPEPIREIEPKPQRSLPELIAMPRYAGAATAPTGNIDKEELSRALWGDDNVTVRRQLNEMAASLGLYSHDIAPDRHGQDQIEVKEVAGASAAHAWDGTIILSSNTLDGARDWSIGRRKMSSLAGIRTLIHESVHGHSPMMPGAYRGSGKWVEEVTTEITARHIADVQYDASTWLKERGTTWDKALAGGYQQAINKTKGIVARHLDKGENIDSLFLAAAIKMRQNHDRQFNDPESYVRHFVNGLDVSPAKRDSIYLDLVTELRHYDGK